SSLAEHSDAHPLQVVVLADANTQAHPRLSGLRNFGLGIGGEEAEESTVNHGTHCDAAASACAPGCALRGLPRLGFARGCVPAPSRSRRKLSYETSVRRTPGRRTAASRPPLMKAQIDVWPKPVSSQARATVTASGGTGA